MTASIIVTAQGGKYLFDGDIAPSLSLTSGKTYTFDLSDSSLSAHPLRFKLDGVSWDEGVTVTKGLGDGVDHIVSLSVPSASLGTLSYYCANHSGMGNDFLIVSNEVFGTNESPTGSASISGAATEGETLTAVTSSIADADGLGSFSYQWLRDGSAISGATNSTYALTNSDLGAAVSVRVSYTDQSGTVESLTSDNTSTIEIPHEYADNFTITSSFGNSVYEGTLSGAEEGSGNQISFTSNQIDPQIRSVYVALKPATGQTTDFWDNFWSNKIGGEPADQFALSTFKSVDGGPATITYTLNADSAVEDDETFIFSVYESNMDFALGRKAIKSFEFTVLDDDATLTFTSELYDRAGEAISDFQLSVDNGVATESYTTEGSGSFDWSTTSGSTVKFEASNAYSNSTKAISSQDALDALKLSVGLSTSVGTKDAFDFMSADFNQDGKVSSQDALSILKYSVGLTTAEQAKWVFVDTNGDYSDVSKSNTSYTEGVSIAELSADTTVGLTGILIGDVNDSYSGLIA